MAQPAGRASLRALFKPGVQKSREALLPWARLAVQALAAVDLLSEQLGGEDRSLRVSLSPALLQIPFLSPPQDRLRPHVVTNTSKCTSLLIQDIHFGCCCLKMQRIITILNSVFKKMVQCVLGNLYYTIFICITMLELNSVMVS